MQNSKECCGKCVRLFFLPGIKTVHEMCHKLISINQELTSPEVTARRFRQSLTRFNTCNLEQICHCYVIGDTHTDSFNKSVSYMSLNVTQKL
jgi:hypothetical protein